MTIANVKTKDGDVSILESKNRNGETVYTVFETVYGTGRGFENHTYKSIQSAFNRYNKVTKILADRYISKIN